MVRILLSLLCLQELLSEAACLVELVSLLTLDMVLEEAQDLNFDEGRLRVVEAYEGVIGASPSLRGSLSHDIQIALGSICEVFVDWRVQIVHKGLNTLSRLLSMHQRFAVDCRQSQLPRFLLFQIDVDAAFVPLEVEAWGRFVHLEARLQVLKELRLVHVQARVHKHAELGGRSEEGSSVFDERWQAHGRVNVIALTSEITPRNIAAVEVAVCGPIERLHAKR